MDKLKLFVENFFVYGFGGIISKIIPLIMIPIITRIMPSTDYYGISDLSDTVVQFARAFAVVGMYDAMYRMFFEKEDENYKKSVCSTALLFTAAMSFVVFIIMILSRKFIAQYFFGNKQYEYIVYLSAIATLVGATNNIISAPTRMQNQRKIFLIVNAVSPILSYSIAISLLLTEHYLIAWPLSTVILGITLEISFGIMNRKWFSIKRFDKKILKHLILIGLPLLPNFLIYWVFNSCDKVMIANIIGVGETGIYSVGSKLGHVGQLIYTAFAGGWQYFAFSTMKEKNQVKTNSLIFEYLGIFSFVATMFICAWSCLIFKTLFTKTYYSGYIVAPYLFLAPLFQMLFQVACNQFLVIKKTWPNMFILSSGAVFNIILNYNLIPLLGIEGAAIATLLGYAASVFVGILVLYKMKLMVISGKFLISVLIMVAFMIAWRLCFAENTLIGTIVAIFIMGCYAYIYREDLKLLVLKLREQ